MRLVYFSIISSTYDVGSGTPLINADAVESVFPFNAYGDTTNGPCCKLIMQSNRTYIVKGTLEDTEAKLRGIL